MDTVGGFPWTVARPEFGSGGVPCEWEILCTRPFNRMRRQHRLLREGWGGRPMNADFHGPEISQRFWPERAKDLEKTRLGGGETLIIFRPLDAGINGELLVDE